MKKLSDNPFSLIKNPIFISQGDLCGVGWQGLKKIINNPTEYLNQSELKSFKRLVIVGELSDSESDFWQKKCSVVSFSKPSPLSKNTKPLFLYTKKIRNYKPGYPSSTRARGSYNSFFKAASIWKSTDGASLVTLPVSKEHIIKSGTAFTGHTEVLADLYQRKTILCMYHPKLAVPLLTNHLPIAKVSQAILKLKAEQLSLGLKQLQTIFNYKKPMAMLGLNPHAGEGGKIGTEEQHLSKIIFELKRLGLNIVGPLPADGFFSPSVRKQFSAGIACYHDQGLVAFKALFGLEGLNITLNLPKLRVSPDHGPAYDLAKDNQGDLKSILYSIRFAIKWGHIWTQESSSLF